MEIGTEKHRFTARVAQGDERERIWSAQKATTRASPSTSRRPRRQIPVVILEPAG